MYYGKRPEAPEFVEGKTYSKSDLELIADDFLRKDSKTELCSQCQEDGEPTGQEVPVAQYDKDGDPELDDNGDQLIVLYPQLECENNHLWHKGEGKAKGIQGKDPILFEEHLHQRKRREIYNKEGTPDPEIRSGIYNRTHPQGRKTNSPDQRRKHGASFFR